MYIPFSQLQSWKKQVETNAKYARITASPGRKRNQNRPFPSCFESHYESEPKYKVNIMKVSFHSYPNEKFSYEKLCT